jgi:iron complex outermembrane recepter protein
MQSPTMRQTRHPDLRYRVAALAVRSALCFGIAGPVALAPAHAQSGPQRQQYNIPAGTLDQVLNRYASAAGVLLSADAALTQGKQSPGLKGSYTAAEGFAKLLGEHQLEAVVGNNGSYSLRPVRSAMLPEVKVTAAEENAWGPVYGYAAKRSATGTKTDTPLIETPQSIAVVTADQMNALKAQTLEDALSYTAGIVSNAGYSSSFDQFISRGFKIGDDSGNIYRDGLKLSGTSWASGQQETYGLERVEFLKGASSVLYGAASPGGIINTVSKRPTGDKIREVNIQAGNMSHRQLAADIGDKLNEDGSLSWRLVALARDENTGTDYVPNDSRYFAPSLKWQPSADTSLTVLANYQERKTAYRYGLPAVGTLIRSPWGKIPSNRFIGEPGFDRQENTQIGIGYVFEHAFSEQTSIRHSLRYIDSEADVRFTSPLGGLDPIGRSYTGRTPIQEYERTSGFSTDTSITHKAQTGAVSHTLLGGLDYSRYKPESEWHVNPFGFPDLDLYAPVYGASPGTLSPYAPLSNKQDLIRTGVYFQDQMKIADKWVLLLGGRKDWTENKLSRYFGAENYASEKADKFTGRAGAVYLADNGFAPYVSFSQSFEPQAGTDRHRNPFKPTTGEQYEMGLRYQPKNADYLISASVFNLTQQNILTPDPANPTLFKVQTGEARSRGFELEAKGRLGRYANVLAAYAYTKAEITESNEPGMVGQRMANVPRNQFSLWGDYQMAQFGLPNLKLGLGTRYIGSTEDVQGTGAKVPSYTLFDAMASYDISSTWRLSLNARNIGDKEYLSCSGALCLYGEPRKVILAATLRW